jgi:two-component system sensor histidine kinase BaeS
LVLLGVVVALLAVVVTAFAVQRLTTSDIRGSIQRDLDTEIEIRDMLAFYGVERGGWDGVEFEVEALAEFFGERIAVATLDGRLLADSERLLFDRDAPLPPTISIIDPASALTPFEMSEADLMELEAANEAFAACLAEMEVPAVVTVDAFGLSMVEVAGDLTPEQEEELGDCLFDDELLDAGTFEDLVGEDAPELNIEPLQLFVGYATEEPGLLPTGITTGFWLALLGVLAGAVLVTVLIARRIARPIATLTGAAVQMRAGDLDTRVAVEGSDEIAQLGHAFNNMAASLQAEDQARRTLTTHVAHELRSPLANLLGYLEAIQDGVVKPDPATIASLHDEATALQHLVTDLQQLSLAEAGQLSLQPEPTDLATLLDRVASAHRPGAEAGEVLLSVQAESTVVVQLDPGRARQVLNNLVSNAIRHTPPGGTVDLVLTCTDTSAQIDVRDTGSGIAPEHLDRIFERFYRPDESRSRATGGSGLGLAIAKQLTEALGGTISVVSEEGRGSTFTIRFPRTLP